MFVESITNKLKQSHGMKPYKPFFAAVGVTHHLASKMPKYQHRIAKASWISPKGFFVNMPKEHRLIVLN